LLTQSELIKYCRKLRVNATNAEHLLWQVLCDRQLAGLKFRRQHPCADFIVDFYCHEKRLVIELDGGGHLEPNQESYDMDRTKKLEELELKVLRFWNNEVLQNLEGVVEEILANIEK